MRKEVIVVGGGASGLVAAMIAARNHHKVTILEHKDKVGKKILATGNGKCNYTNYVQSLDCYRSCDLNGVKKILEQFNEKDTIQLFAQLGIYPKERNGYVYPNSEQAASIVDVLCMEAKRLNVSILCGEDVKKVKKQGAKFQVLTDKNAYSCDSVILSTGGCASKNLGSDGSGYELAKQLGHSVRTPLPALVQLKSNASYRKSLSGVRTPAQVRILVDGKEVAKEKGEILFAAYGISGIPVMQVSRYASVGLHKKKKVQLQLDFLPELPFQEVVQLIQERCRYSKHKTAKEVLIGLFNHKLSYVLLQESGISPEICSIQIKNQQWKRLVQKIKEFSMDIIDTNGFENAQTCTGGVPLTQMKLDTLESKIVSGLYMTGELLDVDGTCGGYNLQWAWSSGFVAGSNIG